MFLLVTRFVIFWKTHKNHNKKSHPGSTVALNHWPWHHPLTIWCACGELLIATISSKSLPSKAKQGAITWNQPAIWHFFWGKPHKITIDLLHCLITPPNGSHLMTPAKSFPSKCLASLDFRSPAKWPWIPPLHRCAKKQKTEIPKAKTNCWLYHCWCHTSWELLARGVFFT